MKLSFLSDFIVGDFNARNKIAMFLRLLYVAHRGETCDYIGGLQVGVHSSIGCVPCARLSVGRSTQQLSPAAQHQQLKGLQYFRCASPSGKKPFDSFSLVVKNMYKMQCFSEK